MTTIVEIKDHDKVKAEDTGSDTDGDELQFKEDEQSLPKFLAFLKWFHNWPMSARNLAHIALGAGLLLIPALCDYLLRPNTPNARLPILNGDFQSSVSIGGVPMMLWFIWLATMWTAYFGASWAWVSLPALFLYLVRPLLGNLYTENKVRPYVDYAQHLHHYLALVVTTIVSYTMAAVFFRFPQTINGWQGVLSNILICAIVGAIFLTLEKLAVQSIAVGFHRTAYMERIVKSKFADYVTEHLYYGAKQKRLRKKKSNTPFWSQFTRRSPNRSQSVSPSLSRQASQEKIELKKL